MTVVAEGIETEEQARRLLALGCERGQGWHLGRPAPAEQARALIAAETRLREPSAA
jgi:EAL domain-containing protein (putative c-di-GMP-specific phosphodiesterase class I)